MVNPIWSCSKASPAYRWRPRYDIKGQLLEVTDPLGRVNFRHKYDTAGNNLRTEHLDSGVKTMVVDALGQPLYGNDAKGARTYTSHDRIGRPTGVWARNKATELFTKRQVLIYGDQQYDVWPPEEKNLKGRLYQHYDEAGKVQIEGYDFKGNPLEKTRRMIKDDQAQPLFVHVVDWTGLDESILDTKTYNTTLAYDALNRVLGTLLPEDVNNHRTAVRPTYNRAGALRSVLVDEAPYLVDIAYNAKGQRLLMAMANGMMTRYAYDPLNFRLLRIRSEKFTMGSPVMYVPNGGVQQDLGYRYDLVGNIIGIRDKAPANGSAQGPGDLLKQFEYDPLKRLLTATGRESTAPASYPTWDAGVRGHDHTATNTYTRAYTYDKVGNVLEEQHTADGHPANSFTKTFNYHPTGADNRLVSYEVGGLTFPLTYDANGNQLKETTSRFHYWDHADLLRYFEVRAGTGAPSVWAHYFYDSAGTRVKKMVSKLVGGGIMHEVTVYIDGVFEETYVQTNGTIDPGRHYNTLHVMDGRSRIATIRIGNDAEDPTPAVKFNLEDHLRTSSVVLDQYGGLINREEYYPFGDTCFGAFAKKRYRYVGKEKDNESGLYYYGARYYAGWMCRFISVDPLAASYAHLNPYNYAGNKPIGDLDIDGMQSPTEPVAETQKYGFASGNEAFDAVANKVLSDHSSGTAVNIEITQCDGYAEGSIEVDGVTAYYDTVRGFYDAEGNALTANAEGDLHTDGAMNNAAGALSISVTRDGIIREQYLEQNPRRASRFVEAIEDAPTLKDARSLAKEAFDTRNAHRTAMQERLTHAGEAYSKTVENKQRTFESMEEKAGKTKEGYKSIAEKSGSGSNKGVTAAAKGLKWLGIAGTIISTIFSVRRIITAPPPNRGQVAIEEGAGLAGGLLGGWLGGMAGAGLATLVLGGPVGWAALGIIAVVSIAGAYVGSELARDAVQSNEPLSIPRFSF